MPINEEGARQIARRSRGTPRVANSLLRRVRDYAEVIGEGRITNAEADQMMAELIADRVEETIATLPPR